MKRRVLIYCEGVTDQVFIADCLETFYSIEVFRQDGHKKNTIMMTFDHGSIMDVGGCGNLTADLFLDQLKDNLSEGGVNIVIFDADEIGKGNNSIANAIARLNNIKKVHDVEFYFYLWPNHCDDGVLETLIRKLVQTDREPVMKCIESHHQCLASLPFDDLRHADLKDFIRYYLYANNVDKTEGRHADYKNEIFWNLDTTAIPDLMNFKIFLDQFFIDKGAEGW